MRAALRRLRRRRGALCADFCILAVFVYSTGIFHLDNFVCVSELGPYGFKGYVLDDLAVGPSLHAQLLPLLGWRLGGYTTY